MAMSLGARLRGQRGVAPAVTSPTAARRRAAAAAALVLMVVPTLTSCSSESEESSAPKSPLQAEPTAGRWRTWLVGDPAAMAVPAPPEPNSEKARADLAEVQRRAGQRTQAMRDNVARWNGPLPTQPWTRTALDFVSRSAKNPPLSSRNYALVHVAMYDAAVSAWHWKYRYNVAAPAGVETLIPAGPEPSYVSEHAAIAGAASRVLAHLYPREAALRLDEMAEQAGQSRVEAGVNTPSDVEAGLELGRKVADAVIAHAKTDGAARQWDGRRPPGIGRGPAFWEPPPGSPSPPTEPLAATWKPWVMSSPSQFRPGPPPAYGTPEFMAAARDVVDVGKNLTEDQKRIAKFWEGNEGTELPAGIVLRVAAEDMQRMATDEATRSRFTVPRTTRALALLTIAMADAGIAAWDSKFTYWNPRPENAIRDSGLDPNWKPFLPTPRFPAYASGSAGYGGAAEGVLSYLFPDAAGEFKRRADEQAISRVYGGIHWRYDAVSADAGRQIARLVVDRAKRDGADG